MNSDVRDILELEFSSKKDGNGKEKKKIKRFIEPMKRPNGVNREVWRLIYKDDRDQPPLIPTDEPKVYKHPKVKFRYGVRKWKWTPFKNPARTDDAIFHHWRLANDESQDYPFAKFNKKIQLLNYTDSEYSQYLEDDNWTRTETDYLFSLCKQYDLNFFIIHDRWDSNAYKTKTIDQIKDRYYKVIGILERLKVTDDNNNKEFFVFDIEHEQKRREQLEKLFNRTKEQVEEEQYLLEELKKIEMRKRERERRSHDVNKLLTAVDLNINSSSDMSITQSRDSSNTTNQQASTGVKRTKQRKSSIQNSESGLNSSISSTTPATSSASNLISSQAIDLNSSGNQKSLKKSLIFKAVVESAGIKFPDSKTAGVSLRSYKMKLPPSVGLKKTKAIEQLLEKLQIDSRPIATEKVCDQFNDLRSDMVLLYELNQALSNCEFELQTLRHRYEAINPGKSLEMPSIDTSTSSSLSQSLIETPQKRISEVFETSLTPTCGLERRRKAALNQTNILKKLRGRNAT